MKKIELLLSAISAILLVLRITIGTQISIFFALSILLLALLYFPLGVFLFNKHLLKSSTKENVKSSQKLGSIAFGFAFSITLIGILFQIQLWPGTVMILGFGIFLMLIGIFIILIKKTKVTNQFYKQFIIRATIILILSICLLSIPAKKKISILYKDYPAFVEKYLECLKEPSNDSLWLELDIEQKKIFKNKK